MKKIFLFLLFAPIFIFGQENKTTKKSENKVDGYSGATYYNQVKGIISGKIKDSDNNSLEYASVSLTNSKRNKLMEGTITDKKGRFLFEDIPVGEYKINISFIGFENKEIIFTTSKSNPNFRDNNIKINPDSKLLSEITIEEKKAIYETRIDKIVYNAENDINESENDATDVLRKAPLLSVDLDGNVSLRGSRNIKFLVNGKASSFFTSDIATALQMIPADQIKTVEVITSPGAKYDGEGDAGIVNIITKKTIIDGYNATISGMGGTKSLRSSLNIKIGKGKFGLSARGGTYGSLPGRIGSYSYERSDWENIDQNGNPINPNILKEEGTSESFYQGYRRSINAFYDVNAFNSVNSSFSFGGRTKPRLVKNSIIYTSPDTTYQSNYSSDKTDQTLNMEWTTDYTKKFANNEERELTIAFQLGGDINNGETDINEENINFFNQNNERVIEETFQIDYVHPFGKKSKRTNKSMNKSNRGMSSKNKGRGNKKESTSNSNKIEIGSKIINRNREIIYSDKRDGVLISPEEEFNYKQLVAASYLSSELNLPYSIGIKTGIRHEYTKASGEWSTKDDSTSFSTPYNDFLPSFVISKSFSPMRSIKASYNQRITRPSVRQINTNNNKLDNRNITIGNPNLKPTISEQYELAINSFGRFLQGSCQLYYKHSTDIIESFLDSISNETSFSSYRNIGESKQFGTSIFGSINLKKLSFRASFDLYNYSGRDATLGYNDWTNPVILYSYFMGGSYDLGKNWKVETFGFFRSPSQTIQGTNTSWSMMSFGIKKTFKNKRGSIGLRIIEPFQKNKEFRSDLDGEYFTQSSVTTTPFRSFGISFKYTFGKLNFKDESKKTNIKNDDIQQERSEEY